MNPRALPVVLLPMVLAACGDRTSPILEELAITANANPSAPLAASVLVRTNEPAIVPFQTWAWTISASQHSSQHPPLQTPSRPKPRRSPRTT